jgi:hypothetical protein
VKVFLFVRDLDSSQVIAIFELSSAFLDDETAIINEKKQLARRYPGPRYSITEARGPDLPILLQGFPELRGTRRTVPIDLWRHHLTRYRYIIERPPSVDRVEIEYVIEATDVPISYLTDALGATADAGGEKTFDALAVESFTDAACSIRVVPLESHNRRVMTIGVYLWPPVEPSVRRRLGLRYQWDGMWNPLRNVGEDEGIVTVSVQLTDRLEIELVLPPGSADAELLTDGGGAGKVETVQHGGRPVLRWIISPAAPGPYPYRIRARL